MSITLGYKSAVMQLKDWSEIEESTKLRLKGFYAFRREDHPIFRQLEVPFVGALLFVIDITYLAHSLTRYWTAWCRRDRMLPAPHQAWPFHPQE